MGDGNLGICFILNHGVETMYFIHVSVCIHVQLNQIQLPEKGLESQVKEAGTEKWGWGGCGGVAGTVYVCVGRGYGIPNFLCWGHGPADHTNLFRSVHGIKQGPTHCAPHPRGLPWGQQ